MGRKTGKTHAKVSVTKVPCTQAGSGKAPAFVHFAGQPGSTELLETCLRAVDAQYKRWAKLAKRQ